jgi:hypothetical protein
MERGANNGTIGCNPRRMKIMENWKQGIANSDYLTPLPIPGVPAALDFQKLEAPNNSVEVQHHPAKYLSDSEGTSMSVEATLT